MEPTANRLQSLVAEYSDNLVETLTLRETVMVFRSVGLQTSEKSLGNGIEQGVYPFGTCVIGESRSFVIYKRLLDDWLRERYSQECA